MSETNFREKAKKIMEKYLYNCTPLSPIEKRIINKNYKLWRRQYKKHRFAIFLIKLKSFFKRRTK